jgi:hypothetical protein
MHKITLYVPETHLEPVKAALFAAGAGRIGLYDSCSWQVKGEGQFRPQAGANPFLGQVGAIETVAEYKVELVCADDCITAAIQALRSAHPYEEPAYDVVKVLDM